MAGITAEMTREINFAVQDGKLDLAQEWEVFAVADDTVTPNLSGYVDPNTAYTYLPQRGTAHPKFPTALVTGHRLVHIIGGHSVLMLVTYRNYGLYQGGPRPIVTSVVREAKEIIPVWRRHPMDDAGSYYVFHRRDWMRPRMLRTEVRWIAGNQQADVQRAIVRNLSHWYQLDGDYYLLASESAATYDGSSRTRAVYQFECWGSHPGFPLNHPLLLNVVAIPPLGTLERWEWMLHPTDPAGLPIVNVIPHDAFSTQGAALPGI